MGSGLTAVRLDIRRNDEFIIFGRGTISQPLPGLDNAVPESCAIDRVDNDRLDGFWFDPSGNERSCGVQSDLRPVVDEGYEMWPESIAVQPKSVLYANGHASI